MATAEATMTAGTTSKTSNWIFKAPAKKLKATQYAQAVLSGRILVCRKVKLACERHMNDLSRQGTAGFPFVFDEGKGHRPVRYIEKFCKPSKGKFKTLVMQPWEHFIIGSLYGWVHKDTGLRRFNEGLIFVAKKQGKSAIVSGLSLYGASKDGERGADVYILANSMKQARKTIYEECQKMVKASPALKRRFRVLRDAIHYDKTNSVIEPQATDSDKLDGLNCHLGLFDEIHEYKNYKLINIIKDSTDAREQPLILYITTAGYVLDGPLMDYYERGADVLEGVISNEHSFFYMAELDEDDDIEDTGKWVKANPNLGVTVTLEKLIKSWETKKLIPAERNSFITKKLNVFVQADEQSFVDFEVIKRNSGCIDPESLAGHNCVGGFDLSDSEDFTSSCLEFPLDDGRVFILSHSFVPQRKVDMDNEKLPFKEWEEEGLLTICKGPYVTKEDVYSWFIGQSKKYALMKIAYDPAKAFRLVQDLKAYGGEEWLKAVRQGALTLSPALKDIKELLLDGKVVFNRNKLFRWYLNNVKLVDDRNGNWLPTKQGRYRKIDGFAAWLNAHTETMLLMPKPDRAISGGVTFISAKDFKKKGR